ncbi:M56 family metallopeptidase [Pinirhizobacter sp.]|jgi:beta-lactamase regulating signal transducer with metallopeptidase domain|uniref:M56 family metallopeptidase n=1 Tax=Pinirhizobacter sp. TaxID=2950432 RepID=UPI002F3FCE4F
MNSLDLLRQAAFAAGMFTASVALVALLRPLFRRYFGAIRAWQLWALPVLALLGAAFRPLGLHVPVAQAPWFVAATTAIDIPSLSGTEGSEHDYALLACLLWLAGAALFVVASVMLQRRYRRGMREATPHAHDGPWPVMLAARGDIGPAVVGAFRPTIVLPADFHQRYSPREQELVLAHEETHAVRRDGLWLLLAHAAVAVMWFNPVAWWALGAFRRDQELACDAMVLAHRRQDARVYAGILVRSHRLSALRLPVGNAWGSYHPLTERIAMLKTQQTRPLGRISGQILLAATAMIVTSAAFTTTAPAPASTTDSLYQMSLAITLHDKVVATPKICLHAGEPGAISGGETDANGHPLWTLAITTTPVAGDTIKVNLRGNIRNAKGKYDTVFPSVQTQLGSQGSWNFSELDGRPQVSITTIAGCPAADEARKG